MSLQHDAIKSCILVTGSHRSGTTFVGKMLTISSCMGYIHEPFNTVYGVEGINQWFLYIKKGMNDEVKNYNLIQDILRGRAIFKRPLQEKNITLTKRLFRSILRSQRNLQYLCAVYNPLVRRYVIKDPIACMSSEYLHQIFNMDVVVLIRHPAAFVASLKRLNWRSDINKFINQRELMSDHLDRILAGLDLENLPFAEEGAILWKCIYHVLFCYLERNPKMIGIRHEDLSCRPVREFRVLYEKLNIKYTQRIERRIRRLTQHTNPVDPVNNAVFSLKRNSKVNIKRWKKVLSAKEVEVIKEITADLAKQYYTDDDW
ncbi:MAG: sulfotransferase [Bacteroidales bacterium]|jgi:hypothetical protein|nr:sulfotransferase [Bacteroidales bacterium]